jgi:glycosyltransferase involved in cell wall biosynthesis
MAPIRILHLITSLNTGGAEMALARLVTNINRQDFVSRVVSLIPPGPVGDQIASLGISVTSLNMLSGRPTPAGFIQLIRLLRKTKPDVLQTWLYHADLLGLLAGKLAGVPSILWNIRTTDMDFSQYRKLSQIVVRFCALLSRFPNTVIANSQAGKNYHERLGYRPREWVQIYNGIDTNKFSPNPSAHLKIRQELGLSETDLLVGMVARYDPMKGYDNFLDAAQIVLNANPNICFVIAGDGALPSNAELWRKIGKHQLTDNIHLLGRRSDIPQLDAALDIYVSPSVTEGFPNAVAEAMACGIPCVATNVGDTAKIVGDSGLIVPARNPHLLADGMLKLLRLTDVQRKELGQLARLRIQSEFNLSRMTEQYEALYKRLSTFNSAEKNDAHI